MAVIAPIHAPLRAAVGSAFSGGGGGGGPPYTPGEQLTNGDWETGDLTGWTSIAGVPSGLVPEIGGYGVDAPMAGWPANLLPGVDDSKTSFLKNSGEALGDTTKVQAYQDIVIPEGIDFLFSGNFAGSFNNSIDWSAGVVQFRDSGDVPITRIFRNTLLSGVDMPSTGTWIRHLSNGFINTSNIWTASFSSFTYAVYYLAGDKTKILLRTQADNLWKYIETVGGWTVDDLSYGVAVGSYNEVKASTDASDNISNTFYPTAGDSSDARLYSDDWLVGIAWDTRTGRAGHLSVLSETTPLGTASARVSTLNRRATTVCDYLKFELI